jgi:AcrR family transcriptional regulator
MTSRGTSAVRRRPAGERRAEIVTAASVLALAEGLESLTLRRVADALGVVPGLVNHYFPAVDDLVAVAFAVAASAEIEEVFAVAARCDGTAADRLRALLGLLVSEDRDPVSLLWLDAWQAAQRRPALRAEVARQMTAWQERLADLVRGGADAGDFRVADPGAAAVRILAMIDGLSIQAAMRSAVDYAAVRDLVVTTTERELGLAPGSLAPR